jgi:hypothetical protein
MMRLVALCTACGPRRLAQFALVLALATAPTAAVRGEVVRVPHGVHYQQTSFFCGPATEQMILDTPAVLNNYVNPVLPSQTALYAVGQANNLAPWFTDPRGMAAALNWADGGFHNYVYYAPYASAFTANASSRTIANVLKDYHIPAGVNIGHGAHWVTIDSVATTGNVGFNQPYTINRFYGSDPWPLAGGLGPHFMLNYNARGWFSKFTPITPQPIWGGRYAFVVEPQGPEALDNGLNNSAQAPAPPLTNPLTAATAATYAQTDVHADSVLSTTSEFSGSTIDSHDESLMHEQGDTSTQGDWIVPYDGHGGVNDVTGGVAIDRLTGVIDYATWSDPTTGDWTLSKFDQLMNQALANQLTPTSGSPTPEPSSLVLAGSAAVLVAVVGLRTRKRAS